MKMRIGFILTALFALFAVAACGDTQRGLPGDGDSAGDSVTTVTEAPEAGETPAGLTEEDVQAMIDKSIAAYDTEIRKWVQDGFVSDDEIEELIDERLAVLVDEAGFLTESEVEQIVARLLEAGVSEEVAAQATESLTPADGPAPGVAGENACTNRENGTDVNQLLLDLGRELKLADSAYPEHVPSWRDSYADWVESDLDSVATLWNQVLADPAREFALPEPALARVYWCPGTEADGATRSGVWRHQMTLPTGKVLHDFGNGVAVQKDCHNLTVFIRTERETPPPSPPPTTVPPVTTPPTGPTTVPPVTSVPPTTVPPTTIVVVHARCESVQASMNTAKKVSGTFSASNATEWRVRAGGSTVASGSGTSFSFAGEWQVTYQLQVKGSSGVWSTTGCSFVFDKPPVNTTPAPATTTAPADSTPPATSPVTLPEDPPEVTAPLPAVSSTAPLPPANPVTPPCDPFLPRGVPGSCG